MAEDRFYATGKRKTSIARVWLKSGSGEFKINNKSLDEYFKREILKMIIQQPFDFTDTAGKYDVLANVHGGGISGQAGAIRHGITKALLEINGDLRPILKKAGFITRDSRVKERKKYGQKGARAKYQFSKR
ncbi:MAG: 30S ribosomal protein S9 [Deltaproteobacteria bacterium CG_4_9_14_3_um_filter_44_9]|nr:MAG: 30S ribosomal protein S9 [Deltaproteobacteria bacterium CG_4_9_14_3_um_filter_44_9]